MPESPTPEDVAWVGAQLRDARLAKGLVYRAAAARLAQINERTWSRTEEGRREGDLPYVPEDASVVKMARAVDLDPKPLLRRLGYDEALADVLPQPAREVEDRLTLLEEQMKEVLGLVQKRVGR